NIRNYPWRYIDDPYLVLVAEFMLHRTQVLQVEPIYYRFVESFPTISKFVTTDIDIVKKILYPLGLNWRIKSLVDALYNFWSKYDCVPKDYSKLISISGIGPYIAGATVCFSQNKSMVLVDTNTVRVIGRLCGMDIRGEARRKKNIYLAIKNVSVNCDPRDFYYSIIDLAHTICVPKKPLCDNCPLFDYKIEI
ncbi:MAG: A/G-specific adenine glycosylase, partial [Candidatus Magnetoglobus multicellularis str. Araruama]